MYVYIQSEPHLWTVGFYDLAGTWHAESDHGNTPDAADRVAYLNGCGRPLGQIIVTVRGGIVEVDKPAALQSVQVIVRDYDVEGGDPEELLEDDQGSLYAEREA